MKRWWWLLLAGLFAWGGLILDRPAHTRAALAPAQYRVNAPYFTGPVKYEQSGVFWLGRIASSGNYADVRVGYNDTELFVNVAVIDRWLWYQASPTTPTLLNWDAVSLYLNLDGATGGTPTSHAYRFDGQLTWWEDNRTSWQAVYRGTGGGWTLAALPFTTTTGWQGNSPNDNSDDDRGWNIFYHIPFASLGLAGRPAPGTLWGLGILVHDRDNASGSPAIPDEKWPETLVDMQPQTWGELHFGLPVYTPAPAVRRGSVTIRNRLNGNVVADAAVGGTMGNMCPGDSSYIWSQWADYKDPHNMQVNVQNQLDISDWPCFSKYFVTFPLAAVPAGKRIISATLTMHQFGNAGQGWSPPPQESYIQVLTIGSAWNQDTLTWNNAPRARENIAVTRVDPVADYAGDPGIPYFWDISYAAAEAYSSGEPLRLALYSADWAYHSGRYFWSSDHDDSNPEALPTVVVTWGDIVPQIQHQVKPVNPQPGQQITYTISILSNGRPLTLTDSIPASVSAPGSLNLAGTGVVTYSAGTRQLKWQGTPAAGQSITLTFPVTVLVAGPLAVNNVAILNDADGNTLPAAAVFIVDAEQIWLPLVWR